MLKIVHEPQMFRETRELTETTDRTADALQGADRFCLDTARGWMVWMRLKPVLAFRLDDAPTKLEEHRLHGAHGVCREGNSRPCRFDLL